MIGWKMSELYLVSSRHYMPISVEKCKIFVKSFKTSFRVNCKQNKRQNSCNNKFYTTTVSDFHFLMTKNKKCQKIKEMGQKVHILRKTKKGTVR